MLLADVTTPKLRVECTCGLKRQYDVAALTRRVGNDVGLPQLINYIATAEGCRKVQHQFHDKCMARFAGLPSQSEG